MTRTLRRRFWQIHLSTATVITLTLGCMLAFQVRSGGTSYSGIGVQYQGYYHGWPCRLMLTYDDPDGSMLFRSGPDSYSAVSTFSWTGDMKYLLGYFAADSGLCILGLLCAAIPCEYALRRRERGRSA